MYRTSTYSDFIKLAKSNNIDIANIHIDLFNVIPKLCNKMCGCDLGSDYSYYICHEDHGFQITLEKTKFTNEDIWFISIISLGTINFIICDFENIQLKTLNAYEINIVYCINFDYGTISNLENIVINVKYTILFKCIKFVNKVNNYIKLIQKFIQMMVFLILQLKIISHYYVKKYI